MPEHVKIFEVGPRDGLQNQKRLIATEDKVKLVNMLSDCGFSHIETTSFVSAKWVPQMADAAVVMAGISRKAGTAYTALTPNMRGYAAAINARADEVAVFASASEGFSQRNINCSIKDSFSRFQPIIEQANIDNCKVRGYISCVTDCPYDGQIDPDQVLQVALRLVAMGCYEISLGDTIGAATRETTHTLISLLLNHMPASLLAGHFHDTNRMALKNIALCLEFGIRTFDSAVGGLGGCPYAEGAKGNVDTVAVVKMLHDMKYETGLNVENLNKAATFARSLSET